METTIDNRGSSAPVVMMLLVALAVLAVAGYSVMGDAVHSLGGSPKAQPAELAVGDIPLSNHAMTGHAGEKFNAPIIQADMKAGKCTPRGYMCKKLDTRIVYCTDHPELAPGRAIGLVIGATVEQILTGFEGSVGYWQNRCN